MTAEAPAATGARLVASDVRVRFPRRGADPVEALAGFDLTVERGEIVALIGPNGCGKSTFLRVASGLLRPDGGGVTLDGEAVDGPDPRIGLVFQEPRLLPWLSVSGNIGFGGRRMTKMERQRRVDALLGRIGLAGYGARWPKDLSGGQQQRVAIARALIGHPEILLLDEPFSALDAFTRASLHELLLDLWHELRPTILMVTHDVDEAVFLADRVVVMRPRPGRVHEAMTIGLPRPRNKLDAEYDITRRNVLRAIDRSLAAERTATSRGGAVSPWV